jgi:putative ABC transport system substrate-binding protein
MRRRPNATLTRAKRERLSYLRHITENDSAKLGRQQGRGTEEDRVSRPTRRVFAQRAAATAAVCAMHPLARSAEPARAITVIYPDIGEPFRAVFMKIIEGVEDRVRGPVASIAVGPATTATGIADEVRRRDVRVVIALGRNGLKIAAGLEGGVAVVAGCVVSVPENEARGFTVHTLAPDPALLLARLRQLMPGVRKVSVIIDPAQNGWLIRLAREAARMQGLELLAYEARDLGSALRFYGQILAAAEPKRDALWLAQDSTTVEDNAVLPLVLKEAWNRSLVVFSSSVAHVKRGALFSLYPDNLELGRALGGSALRALGGGKNPDGVLPLREVRAAVNTRTAAHLGLEVKVASFDLVFPEP